MASTIRLYVRTGIVGAWAVMVGVALLFVAQRFLELFDPQESTGVGLTTAELPLLGFISSILMAVYNGGAMSVLLGIVLVFVGWYRLLRLV